MKKYLKPLTDKNAQLVTKAICNKGFSGNSGILSRSNFGVSGQESRPQSLTAYSLNLYLQPPKMHPKIHNILFDLDGTLTDPKEGIINSILYALEKLGVKEERISELDAFIGPPLRGSFITRYGFTDEFADKAMGFYREYFSEKGLFENRVYSEIPDLLNSLNAHKYNLYVATSKPTVFSERIIRYFGLDKYFRGIVGSNLDNTRTEKSEVIAHLVSVYSLQPENSVMIGDRKHDIIGAKNNFMRSIAVTYGYGSLEEITLHKPDFIVNSCDELKSLFEIK